MRLFIAIELSMEARKALIGTMHELKQKGVKGNYVPSQNLHLTLAFIGETNRLDDVKAAMDELKYAPFRLSFTELGTFGDLLYVGAKGNQGMKGCVHDLRAILDRADIPYDTKEFKPHITLVRKMSGGIPKGFQVKKAEMMVKKISLMKSERKNGTMVYTEVYSI